MYLPKVATIKSQLPRARSVCSHNSSESMRDKSAEVFSRQRRKARTVVGTGKKTCKSYFYVSPDLRYDMEGEKGRAKTTYGMTCIQGSAADAARSITRVHDLDLDSEDIA